MHLYWISCEKTKPRLDDILDLVPFDKSLQSGDLDNMKTQILFSLQQMEDPTQPLVMWEIVAALASLKHVTSAEFVISVILDWVSTWCKGDTDTLYTDLDSLLPSLASAPVVSSKYSACFTGSCYWLTLELKYLVVGVLKSNLVRGYLLGGKSLVLSATLKNKRTS